MKKISRNRNSAVRGVFFVTMILFVCLLHPSGTADAQVTLSGWTGPYPGTYQYVKFARYPQEQAASTPLQPVVWRVLSVTGTLAGLLSEYNLDALVFDEDLPPGNNYGIASLRGFLTDPTAFYSDSHFAPAEKAALLSVPVTTVDGNGLNPKNIDDTISILDITESTNTAYGFLSNFGLIDLNFNISYLSDVNRIAKNTAHTASKTGMQPAGSADRWWLRSPKKGGIDSARAVSATGGIGSESIATLFPVRPSCIVKLDSVLFKSGTGTLTSPFNLYVAPTLKTPTASVNGSKLILTFPDGPVLVQAESSNPPKELKTKFTVLPANAITDVTFNDNDTVVLTLTNAVIHGGSDITIAYTLDSATDSQAIGIDDTPNVIATFAAVPVTNDTPPLIVPVTGVTLNTATLNLETGESETLTATVAPAGATDKSVAWSSSAPAIATVNTGGKVTAVAAGTTTITVTSTDGGKTATCNVTVTTAPAPKPSDGSGGGCNAGFGFTILAAGLVAALRRKTS